MEILPLLSQKWIANSRNDGLASAFSVRYERNPYFTGREEFLHKLSRELSERRPKRYNHRIALYGLGGVGKTQIALEYAYRHESDYSFVFWISAADQGQLLSGFVDIAKTTGCVRSEDKPQNVAKSVLKWLRVTEGWLLIIDNLDDITIADGYLPATSGAGHTLITTRNKNSDGIPAEGIEVMVMDAAECVRLLLDRTKLADTAQIQAEARNIVQELGYLPLAIEQAAGYIRNSQNIEEYLETYKTQRREFLNWRREGNHLYNYTVGTAWKMSLRQLQTRFPNSIVLIHHLVFLNPDEILLEFIKSGMQAVQRELREIIENKLLLRESLDALESYSLIRVFSGQKIRIHRLVQAVIQDDLDAQIRSRVISDVLRLGLRSFPNISDETQRQLCRRYRWQVVACLENSIGEKQQLNWLNLADLLVKYLCRDGFYADSVYWSESTFNIRKQNLGLEHRDTLSSMNNLAVSYRRLGRVKEAAQLHEETLEISRRVLGLEHQETLSSMNNLAVSYRQLGRVKEAALLHEETLEIGRRVLGLEHQETLNSMNNLAVSYCQLSRVKEAALLHEETLEIKRRVLGLEHQETLNSMNNLAESYRQLGRVKEAALLHEETLEIKRRVLGLEHQETLNSMNNLAVSYCQLSRVKEAALLHEETLEIKRRVLGLEHQETLNSMNNLAESYRQLGRVKEAALLHEETLEIKRRVLGLEHQETLSSMNNLAESYRQLGRVKEAALLHEETLEIRRRVLGLEHQETLNSMNNLAESYRQLGRVKEAALLHEETLEIRRRVLGLEHQETLSSMNNLAESYRQLG